MSAAKHTPGPWHYRRGDEWSHSVVTYDGQLPDGSPNCWAIAEINQNREPEHEANARLIAAAPELLAALSGLLEEAKRCFALFESGEVAKVGAMDSARAAIAKATGSAA